MKKTNEKMIKGYKGFSPGMICRGKQYSENATFEEEYAKPCVCGIHFCRYPLDVFNFYPPADEAGLNEFAEVETLSPVLTDDNIKFCSKKLYIKKRISLAKLCQAAVNFILANIDKINKDQKSENYSVATNTGDGSAATNTGHRSAATNTGDWSAATNTGDCSAAIVSGKKSIAVATGFNGKASGALGCWIACAEWEIDHNEIPQPIDFKAVYVDGEKIKADTYYMLKNGKFVEVKDA